MKKFQYVIALLAFALMGYSSGLRAEDTDIYVSNAENNGIPNVLFVIDNGADFSASASLGCSAYGDGSGAPSTGTDNTAGVLQCSLVSAIQGLKASSVNIGIMVSNANNFAETKPAGATDVTKGGYHELCSNTGNGGCLLRKLSEMNATGKANMIKFIKGWQVSSSNGGNTTDQFLIKVNSSAQASTMQEAWAYFAGKLGLSGINYGTSILASGCQRNFIVYISNTQKAPNQNEYSTAKAALADAQTGSSAKQRTDITGVIEFKPEVCASQPSQRTSLYTLAAGNNYADEWARFMNQKYAGTVPGVQNITTYTIGIESSGSQCRADTFGLVASMGDVGGGGFFRVSSVQDLTDALNTVLNQVQAVNSVFSSASLPVSVNADGSYLNQIYLGMFRPDTKAAPRWLGNLKQYHLIKSDSGKLVQGDSAGKSAINPNTGFIDPGAVSFWSKKDTTKLPDSVGGFWVNNPAAQGVAESGYDSPDGEVVEKGGVSQQLRLENLQAAFSGAQATSTNPRRVYVYCPAGGCDPATSGDLTLAANQFSTGNGAIPAGAFGTDTILPVQSIVRTGTTAVVTTVGNHGLTGTPQISISGANQTEYNVTQSVTVTGSATFTITGLPDNPTTPSTGLFSVGLPGATTVAISGMSRPAAGSADTVNVTVTTSAAHNFSATDQIQISGATPASPYAFVGTPANITTNSFTFPVTVTPPGSAAKSYTMQFNPTVYTAQAVALTNPATGQMNGTTNTSHGLHAGQQVVIVGSSNTYSGTYTIATVPTPTTFTITGLGNGFKSKNGENGTVKPDTTAKGIGSLSRSEAADFTATATATGLPSNWFGAAAGDTFVVTVKASTTDEGYATAANTVIGTCTNAGCTTVTYPVTVSPTSSIGFSSATVGLKGSSTDLTSAITRSGTTATVTLPAAASGIYTNGQELLISPQANATIPANESAYLGKRTIACSPSPCTTSFTFEVPVTPQTPATGLNIIATAEGIPPDRDTLIKWIRGQDNYAGEKGPANGVTVRGSVHGDVLHSRPVVINYGDSRGIVVYYGANDGLYRAVNGAQTSGNVGGVGPGGELWSLLFPEHFGQYLRQRLNTPELKFPTTVLRTARPKDYFADGLTGSYQQLKADGTIDKAYIFVTMRRGGRFMYGLDVSDPTKPTVMWRVDSTTTGLEELGQTWSRPRVLKLQGGGLGLTKPVLVFGAGYDSAQDSEPPAGDTIGRGIFVLDAVTGAVIWQANSTCTSSATCRNVPGMLYSIPSDVAAIDRDGDGLMDKLYVGDMGGNVWRVDVSAADSGDWAVTKVGALGCDSGATPAPPSPQLCPDGTAPRKFFFAPAVLSVRAAGAADSYEAISIVSGDREHPLKSTDPASSYFAHDKFFMIKDLGTSVPPPTTPATQNVTLSDMVQGDAAITDGSFVYDGSRSGFYISFAQAEKGVNAPNATEGMVFFSTNRPVPPTETCAPNLGQAKAYAVSPFTGALKSNLLVGGGLPPSPVSGLITIENPDGTETTEKFCIGCAAECTNCSALENSPPINAIPKNLKRTYWYKK